jgi:hypothetical protein
MIKYQHNSTKATRENKCVSRHPAPKQQNQKPENIKKTVTRTITTTSKNNTQRQKNHNT